MEKDRMKRAENQTIKKQTIKRRVVSFVLGLTMVVTMMPAIALAEANQGEQAANQEQQSQDQHNQDQNDQQTPNQDQQEQEDQQPAQPEKTVITGFNAKASKKSRKVMSVTVNVLHPEGRDVILEQKLSGKWIEKGRFATQSQQTAQVQEGQSQEESQDVRVIFPNSWWKKETTKWRLRIEANDQAQAYITEVMTLKTKRFYQNPKKYIQIKNKISKHGKHYYTYPVQVNNASTRKQHVNAMIKAAKKYLGDPYIVCRSGKPGKGVDCSGLVMQACYAAGVDLWPSNPYRHRFPKYEYESTRIAKMKNLKTVPYSKIKKGDLVFYSKRGTVIHIAIYIGGGKIIHSWPGRVQISRAKNGRFGHLSKVKRVFIAK